MAIQQKANEERVGMATYIASWAVGIGVFVMLIWAALWLIQE
ncbi:MAG TPA: hypothetical protein VF135_04685 [Terriglobales bacterium]